MMWKSSYTLALLLVPLLLFGTGSVRAEGPVRLLTTIPVPVSAANTTGGLYSFDISFVDQSTQTYYLADRSNAVVDVVDAKTGTFDRQIAGGFRGVAVVNGVVQGGQSGQALAQHLNGDPRLEPRLGRTGGHGHVIQVFPPVGCHAPPGFVQHQRRQELAEVRRTRSAAPAR